MSGPARQATQAVQARTGMSHRAAVLVSGAIAVILFRWVVSGKLGAAAKAWAGTGTGTNTPAGASGGSGTTSAGGSGGATFSGSTGSNNPFGFTSSYGPRPQTGWLVPDQAVMPTSEELNYGTGGRSVPFTLPGGDNWVVVKNQPGANGGVGGIEVFRSEQTGGLLGFLHLQRNVGAALGSVLPGGSVAGLTGWPLTAQYGVGGVTGPANAHLAVLLDPATQKELGL